MRIAGTRMIPIRKELAEYGLSPRKKLGQHFIVNRDVLNKIVRIAEIKKDDILLEVGPGLGEMTFALARQAKKVIAVEIDSKFIAILHEKMKHFPNVVVVQSDILSMDFKPFFEKEGRPIKVVANLPYQISTPLLFRFIESKEIFLSFTLMLQKEVAKRIVASPGGKEYGPLSVFIQMFMDVSTPFFIKPSAFFPPPQIESAVVQMAWKEKPMTEMKDQEWFKRVVKACFGFRRKTLVNALKHSGLLLPESIKPRVERIGIDPRRRPETLTIQEFVHLADALK